MGKLLSLLARDESTCCTPKTYDVFLDFENAAPTDLEREVYEEVDHVLRQSEIVLDEIQCYKVGKREVGKERGMFMFIVSVVSSRAKDIAREGHRNRFVCITSSSTSNIQLCKASTSRET
uniref:CYRIA/CYRIB Rac1 binding domain-containing protein n=1 Tax=Anopheles culicifacies TaxID=139723 RepID=A0A182MAM0_9DIPT